MTKTQIKKAQAELFNQMVTGTLSADEYTEKVAVLVQLTTKPDGNVVTEAVAEAVEEQHSELTPDQKRIAELEAQLAKKSATVVTTNGIAFDAAECRLVSGSFSHHTAKSGNAGFKPTDHDWPVLEVMIGGVLTELIITGNSRLCFPKADKK